MAKIKGIKRLMRNEFPKEVQEWIDVLLTPLNEALDSVMSSLRNKLTSLDNFYVEIKTFEFTHNVYLSKISHNLTNLEGVDLIKPPDESSDDYMITSYHWYTVDNQTIAMKILFNGAGVTKGKVKFKLWGS